ncbi:uncharacterized protein [Amphiura filiformis]|uniref:uncharacterized protein n=1 Tax=Amphiura filiformis TaxID=82378 RepID=UPI003B213910
MVTFEDKATSILNVFEDCTRDQQNEVLQRLLLKCKPLQLRVLYNELKPLLAVDFAATLPPELTERIFSFLTSEDLCHVACCSKVWRDRANNDMIWLHLCKLQNWQHYGTITDLSSERPFSPNQTNLATSLSSPTFSFDSVVSSTGLQETCKWKQTYMRAHHLDKNWETGRYRVAPLLRGHKEQVTCIDCDDTLLVSGSSDTTVRIWNVFTGECIHKLEEHTDSVTCLKMKKNLLVTGCADSIVRVFDAKTARCRNALHGHTSGVDCICFDGTTIISASSDHSLRVWTLPEGVCRQILRGHTDDIQFVITFNHLAASAAWDNTVKLWDTTKGLCLHTLQGHTEVVYCCQFDNSIVVSGGGDETLRIWDTATGMCKQTLYGHKGEVYCLQYNSEIIASGASDSTVILWNHRGECLNIMQEHIGVVRCLCLHGNKLITGGDRKKIVVWNAKNGNLLNVVHRNPSLLHVMWVSDTRLITASPESPGVITILSYW